ncbi:hypothetical protein A3840_10895 [Devosia elaeis]|uniref:Uncharacterized protein n=1 Tax=Devosia elaeis TaxID=1770058 RepID=A0A178HW88_9HYPH|nr:hypothetical protein A3840_10895 [Devosia elaeis]
MLSLALSHVDDWLDVDAAMEMALAGQRKGSIETIKDDGMILATQTCSAMMLDMFDVDVARITPAAVESTACQLRAALKTSVRRSRHLRDRKPWAPARQPDRARALADQVFL